VEILGLAILVLAFLPWMWFVNRTLEQRQWKREPLREQEAIGSKRWHLPAFAFLCFLVIVSTLLLFAKDPG
jgi:hypothetical protein